MSVLALALAAEVVLPVAVSLTARELELPSVGLQVFGASWSPASEKQSLWARP